MLSYCLKCGNNTENKNPTVVKTKNGRIIFYITVQFVVVKNRDLLKNKKLADHYVA